MWTNALHKLPLVAALISLPLVSACAIDPVSSHSAEYMNELLSSRVEITHFTANPKDKVFLRKAQALYYSPDGQQASCWIFSNEDTYFTSNTALWMVVPEKKLKTRLKFYEAGVDPKSFKGEPFTYDAATGLSIQHRWNGSRGRWLDLTTGWYQNSWPRAFVNACPDLKLPSDLPINEKQTSLDWYELKEQDPDAIIKNFKPSFAEGSQWQPETQPSNEFKQFIYSNDGYILKDSDGVSYTINEKRQQLWKLNENLETVDVAQLSIENGVMLIDWNSGAEQRFEIGTPIPLTPSKTRHPAFAFTDWLQTQDALTVAFAQWPSFSIQFLGDNNIMGAPTEHPPVAGKWYHDAQDIIISVTGLTGDSKVITHPWKDVAKQTTWPVASSLK